MRIVVTGAGGGLGRALLSAAGPHHDLIGLTHADLDIGDHDAVMQTVVPLGPDLIVNCAAFTAVDANETDPVRAFRDNAQGPQSLALAARDVGARILHVSTDYVFDGERDRPYDETDVPRPLSVYGRTKLAGERMVRDATPEHVIVRTGFVFGGGRDHLSTQVAALAGGEDAAGIADRIGSPTWVVHLAERLIPLALSGRPGVFHLAGPEPASWFQVLERCKEMGGFPGRVIAQQAGDLGLPAPRPRMSALASLRLPVGLVEPMPPLDAALAALLAR
jgi:dTDP-4-dehydrorhamnose reductase